MLKRTIKLLLLIEGEKDIEKAEEIAMMYGENIIKCKPIYNGRNIKYFKENVYLNKYDIFTRVQTHNELFCNEKLNRNMFGKIYIKADGSCFTDLSGEIKGNISNNSIGKIIFKELSEGIAWKKTRSSINPCSDCLYSLFCPPISDYENVIKKNNLCHIKK